jgi:hypothetical protein
MDSINTEQRFRVIRKLDKMVSGESAKKSRNADTEVLREKQECIGTKYGTRYIVDPTVTN